MDKVLGSTDPEKKSQILTPSRGCALGKEVAGEVGEMELQGKQARCLLDAKVRDTCFKSLRIPGLDVLSMRFFCPPSAGSTKILC